jgi:hypothetical protein
MTDAVANFVITLLVVVFTTLFMGLLNYGLKYREGLTKTVTIERIVQNPSDDDQYYALIGEKIYSLEDISKVFVGQILDKTPIEVKAYFNMAGKNLYDVQIP